MKAIKTIIEKVLKNSLEDTNLTEEQKNSLDFQNPIKSIIEKALRIQRKEVLKEIGGDRKRVYYNKILVIIASLIAIVLVWGIIFTGTIK